MAFEMIDREVRFAETERQTFRDRSANHQANSPGRDRGRGKCIDLRQARFSRSRGASPADAARARR